MSDRSNENPLMRKLVDVYNAGLKERLIDCQDEPPPIAQTPEEADEILSRWEHG